MRPDADTPAALDSSSHWTGDLVVLIMLHGSHNDTVVLRSRSPGTVVDLTCQHKNHTLLVEGPEIPIRPVGTRRVTASGSG